MIKDTTNHLHFSQQYLHYSTRIIIILNFFLINKASMWLRKQNYLLAWTSGHQNGLVLTILLLTYAVDQLKWDGIYLFIILFMFMRNIWQN